MNRISIDVETRSSVDLKKCGMYKYSESPDFDILLFGYSVDNGGINVVDLTCGEKIPEEIIDALIDGNIIKTAYHASFERVCLSVWLRRNYPGSFPGNYLDPASWRCTMVWAAYNGLPLSLEKVGAILGFEEQKLKGGKELIRYFCCPCKPTKSNGGRTWNLPEHAPEKWVLFKKYNERDVQVEIQIQERLRNYPVPDFVWDEYHLDQEINDRGIRIDRELVRQAIRMDALSKESITKRMIELTGLENPNSVMQLSGWLQERGLMLESLGKKEVAAAIKDAPADIAEVLSLRLMLAKSSVKKYQAMENSVCEMTAATGCFLSTGPTGLADGPGALSSYKTSIATVCQTWKRRAIL